MSPLYVTRKLHQYQWVPRQIVSANIYVYGREGAKKEKRFEKKNNGQRFVKFDENYKPTQPVNSADTKNKTHKEKYTKQ